MNEIDWSHAPEGATHYNHTCFDWYKVTQIGAVFFWNGRAWEPARFWDDSKHDCIQRPTTPSWSGEGLPPVGVECEALWTSATGEYVRVVVVGYDHDQSYAVYRILAGVRAGEYESSRQVDVEGHPCFRLTRTPEQSAEDEREAAIDAMLAATPAPGSDISLRVCEQLYDAGYRKP